MDKAIRLVNQSIGRCIRHSKDYAMVFLMDVNFKYQYDKFSLWFKNKIIIGKQENDIYSEIDRFFYGEFMEQRKKLLGDSEISEEEVEEGNIYNFKRY